ncbi:glycosyltransferase involved in cell wall biosynthesis [Pedobacter sp. UYP30]|uniref:glycosyltransferase n=1 Tax=Pedobacter sp. UYP30 TaxID=1756400 RepID=UPI00339B22BA
MKKILTINNTIFYEENSKLYLNKETGAFFVNLQKLGHVVSAFQISQPKTSKDTFANFALTDTSIKIYEVKRNGNRALSFIRSFFVIQKAIVKNDFVYIFYPGPICQIIAMLCIVYRKPYGVYIRGEQGIESSLSKTILRKAEAIFTISPSFTEKISKLNQQTHTIRPMIGFKESDIVVNKKIDFTKNVYLLYVGRLVFDKGIFELLEAFETLIGRSYNLHLNLVGNGPDYDKLVSMVKQKGLESNVSFFGMVSDKEKLINIYKGSDIFVLPTYHEGFPRVLYEAMIMHMPILTTFVGTISYLMKDDVNSLEIIPKSAQSIVNQIEKLINQSNLAQRLGNSGLKTIKNYLDDKKVGHAEQLNQFLETL